MRHDQAGFLIVPKKMFQQNLRPQIEKVRGLVEEQQVWLMEQQSGQLDARLPAAGEFRQRPIQVIAFDFELAGHLAAFPVGLAAVTHQEFEGRFARQERIVLPQIAQPQLRVPNHLAAVEVLFIQDHAEQRALASAIAPDEANLDVVRQCRFRAIEQHLVAVAFVSIFDL